MMLHLRYFRGFIKHNKALFLTMIVVLVLLFSLFFVFLTGICTIEKEVEVIAKRHYGDFVVTSINQYGEYLDYKSFGINIAEYSESAPQKRTRNPIDITALAAIDDIESYSGRLRYEFYTALACIVFNDVYYDFHISGCDFSELSSFDYSFTSKGITIDKEEGIALSETLVKAIEKNSGKIIKVGDYVQVENYSLAPSAPANPSRIDLEVVAIIPNTGGRLYNSTESRNKPFNAYVDYSSMARLFNIGRKKLLNMYISNLDSFNLERFSIKIPQFDSSLASPNQYYIRLKDGVDHEKMRNVLSSLLINNPNSPVQHVLLDSETFLANGSYGEPIKLETDYHMRLILIYFIFSLVLFLLVSSVFFQLLNIKRNEDLKLFIQLGERKIKILLWLYVDNLLYNLLATIIAIVPAIIISKFVISNLIGICLITPLFVLLLCIFLGVSTLIHTIENGITIFRRGEEK